LMNVLEFCPAGSLGLSRDRVGVIGGIDCAVQVGGSAGRRARHQCATEYSVEENRLNAAIS